jgi:septum formation protein
MPSLPLILASRSPYRAELLARLRVPFIAQASAVDETPLPGEAVADLTRRLAEAKARALLLRFGRHWILGCDQSAAIDGQPLGQPGSREQARAQLAACSGRSVRFVTAIALLNGTHLHTASDVTTVRFRSLSSTEIARYVAAEPALDCAGSFKVEGYGITLFEAVESRDPSALVGLPLLATATMLRAAGWQLP